MEINRPIEKSWPVRTALEDRIDDGQEVRPKGAGSQLNPPNVGRKRSGGDRRFLVRQDLNTQAINVKSALRKSAIAVLPSSLYKVAIVMDVAAAPVPSASKLSTPVVVL
jgi:hypothetical protein